tara:strand:- start:223 stop:486 length:264 start_codon:yes stop_codon:yes gene_type:complete
MPKILDRLTKQLKNKGYSKKSSFAIATSKLQKSGNLKKGTSEPTTKGVIRGNMTPGQRAKDRASKASGNPASTYKYNSKTNRATKRK